MERTGVEVLQGCRACEEACAKDGQHQSAAFGKGVEWQTISPLYSQINALNAFRPLIF